jgi:hypothetical protein
MKLRGLLIGTALATSLSGCFHYNSSLQYPLSMREHEERKLDGVVGSVNTTTIMPGPDSILYHRVSIKIPRHPTNPSRGAMNHLIYSDRDTVEANMVFTNRGRYKNGFPFSSGDRVSLYLNKGFPEDYLGHLRVVGHHQEGKIERRKQRGRSRRR